MKLRSNLKTKIWKYLILFSFLILLLIWILNISSLGSFYENSKKKQLLSAVKEITQEYDEDTLEDTLDNLTYSNDFCIEVYDNTFSPTYISNDYKRGCMSDGNPLELNVYKKDFIKRNLTIQNYEFINPRHDNKILMSALKLGNNYIFINTSLDPIDSTVQIIKHQFIYILIAVLLLSLIIAYFISKRISKPIEKINSQAHMLATGNFNVTFDSDSSIEEIKELADTLNDTKKKLEELDIARQELLANVSHDLKTPLTMIKAYAEMIRDLTYKDEKKRNANLNTIIEETDRLNILVNDILELSKLKNQEVILKEEKFELNSYIKNIIKKYDIYVTKDGFNIKYKNQKKINVIADKFRIEQVMYNLLNNALNYTGDDKLVEIIVTEQEKTVLIEIKDTGTGISKDDLNHIWDKYYKINKTYSRVQIGSGIGLSIVKNILDKQGLNYGVKTSSSGSTFYFEIKKYLDTKKRA